MALFVLFDLKKMSGRKVFLVCAAAAAIVATAPDVDADGWRFWKKKKPAKSSEASQSKPNQQGNKSLEKETGNKRKKLDREEKKQREEFVKALKEKEREMLRRQRDAQRKFQKSQRSQQRRLQRLLRRHQSAGKSSWRFWKRSDASDGFFLPQ